MNLFVKPARPDMRVRNPAREFRHFAPAGEWVPDGPSIRSLMQQGDLVEVPASPPTPAPTPPKATSATAPVAAAPKC